MNLASNCTLARGARCLTLALTVLGPALAIAPPASAGAVFSASIPCLPAVSNSSTPVTLSGSCSNSVTSIEANAVSQPGHVGAALKLSESIGGDVSSIGIFSTQVTFSATEGSTLTSIPVQLNLNLNGMLSGVGTFETVWRVFGGFGSDTFDILSALDTGGFANHSESGISFSSGGDTFSPGLDTVAGTLTTAVINALVGVPINVSFELSIDGFGSPGSMDDKFLSSLDFPVGTDVFTLPSGFTANDPDGIIVNNRFTAAVPELSTWAMLLVGFAGIGFVAYRRKSRPALMAA